MAKTLKPPGNLSEKDVNKGIAEYKKLQIKKPSRPLTPYEAHLDANPGKPFEMGLGTEPKSISIPKAKPLNPARVGMAKPIEKIGPRVESRVRAIAQPVVERAKTVFPSPSLQYLKSKLEGGEKRVVGGLAKIEGSITPKGSPFQTQAALGSAVKGSSGLFGKVKKLGGLGRVAASFIPNKNIQTAIQAVGHAETAKDAAKVAARGLGVRAAPLVGAAFAVADIAGAVGAARGAVKAEKEAEHNREFQAVKYASPLVHQQRLRSGAVGSAPVYDKAMKDGAMPDSPKTGVPKQSAANHAPIKPGRSEFGSAFASARKTGAKVFEFKGKKYNTNIASEPVKVSKVSSQNKETFLPNYDDQKFVNNVVYAGVDEAQAPVKKSKDNFGDFLKKNPKFKR